MATASSIAVTEGSGKNIASHSISETTTKELQRVELNNSAGTELGNSTTPLQVSLANTGANATKLLVTPDANAAVNVAQMNGVTTTMGNGVSGTGVQRVAVASDNTPFQIASSNETTSVYSGTTALTPLFATIVASSSGATTIISLVSSKKIRVLAMQLVANAAVNVKWQSHVTPTDITGLAYLAANGGYVLPYNPVGWFQTISGEALDINLSGAVAVGGSITYITV